MFDIHTTRVRQAALPPLAAGYEQARTATGSATPADSATPATPAAGYGSAGLGPVQLFFLAASVFAVSAGYGALMPLLPAWLSQHMPDASPAQIARHAGFLSGVYAAGMVVAAPLWGLLSDHLGRPRVLIAGLTGYVLSLLLLLLLPSTGGMATLYGLRAAAGLFAASVLPLVPALVAAHTPKALRARRFAWLGAASLLGFLLGPGLYAAGSMLAASGTGSAAAGPVAAPLVIVLPAVLSAVMMLGLAVTLPAQENPAQEDGAEPATPDCGGITALLWLSAAVMFVLSGFETGIVLQDQQHAGLSPQQVALMFAQCSLVMLGVNALLFFTPLLERVSPPAIMAAGALAGSAGLAVLALNQSTPGMFIGISLTAAGTGLMLPVISYLAAGTQRRELGVTMGALAAAGGMGQALGSTAGGWLFSLAGPLSYAWLMLPLLLTLALLPGRPSWHGGGQFTVTGIDKR